MWRFIKRGVLQNTSSSLQVTIASHPRACTQAIFYTFEEIEKMNECALQKSTNLTAANFFKLFHDYNLRKTMYFKTKQQE